MSKVIDPAWEQAKEDAVDMLLAICIENNIQPSKLQEYVQNYGFGVVSRRFAAHKIHGVGYKIKGAA